MGNLNWDPRGLSLSNIFFSLAGWTTYASHLTSLRHSCLEYKIGKLKMLVFIVGHFVWASHLSRPGRVSQGAQATRE